MFKNTTDTPRHWCQYWRTQHKPTRNTNKWSASLWVVITLAEEKLRVTQAYNRKLILAMYQQQLYERITVGLSAIYQW